MLFAKVKENFLGYLGLRNYSEQTIAGYGKDLKVFERFLLRTFHREVALEEIEEHHLEAYIHYLQNERKLQPRSQNRYMCSIRSMYQYAVKKRIIKENVAQCVEAIQYETKTRDYLTIDELELLFKRISHPIGKVAIMTMAYTGVRVSELLNVKIEDLDVVQKTLKVKGKGDKERLIPISDKLLMILLDYLQNIRCGDSHYLFATKKTGRLSAAYVNKILKASAEKAGIHKNISAHTLRHSFASYLVKKKVDLATLQQLLGHSNIRTTSIYLHVDNEQLKEAVNVFE